MAKASDPVIRADGGASRPHLLGIDDSPFRKGQPDPVLFAARPSVRESSLALLGAGQLARLGDSATVVGWGVGSSAADFGAHRKGSELWWPLLLVVIALAAIEIVLAQWFSRSK